jgi:two-component system, NtrC family, nitrogen regulation response regulator NtrX
MLPRLLILDDLFGRNLPGGRNVDRDNLCAHFLWQDVTGDAAARASRQKIINPIAEAVFCRAQIPACANIGDTIENEIEGALEVVRKGWSVISGSGGYGCTWAMLLLDLCFYTGKVTEESHRRTPGMPEGRPGDDHPRSYFGLTLLETIHREFPELPVFILSSKLREDVSLEFSRRGALGFIARDDPRGPVLLQEALLQHGLLADSRGEVVGNSVPILLALREARRAARHRENLLIRGERGTGKELLARFVHRVSNRSEEGEGGPFITVNSAVFTVNLFASEFFGIEPRTATGVEGKLGLVEMANGGDLFLDEIADMPPEAQAAILRLLQERQITPVGSRRPKRVDVRFLSATNADLEDESRGFRSDLLDRLRIGGTVWLPSLRERPIDIPLLVDAFVREAEAQRKGSLRRDITQEALDALRVHNWPGNIRELRSVIFDAVNRFPDVEHLVSSHLRIERRKGTEIERFKPKPKGAASDELKLEAQETSFGALLSQIAGARFDTQDIGQWAGRLGDIQYEHAWLVARMLQAALEVTKRRTPEKPAGIIQIHPAVKLLTGNSALSASKAADILKRLLGPLEKELEGDLRAAYEIAVRLRPKSAGISLRKKSTNDA